MSLLTCAGAVGNAVGNAWVKCERTWDTAKPAGWWCCIPSFASERWILLVGSTYFPSISFTQPGFPRVYIVEIIHFFDLWPNIHTFAGSHIPTSWNQNHPNTIRQRSDIHQLTILGVQSQCYAWFNGCKLHHVSELRLRKASMIILLFICISLQYMVIRYIWHA